MTFIGSDDIHTMMLVDIMQCNIPTQNTLKSLNVLLKIIQNIRENPQQDKFRHLKKTNAAIGPMLDMIGVKDLLSSIGFDEGPQTWDYQATQDSYKIINKVYGLLNSRIGSFEVISELDPAMKKIVDQSKAKYEQQKKYKQQIIDKIKLDRKGFKQKLEQKQMKKQGKY